MSSNLLSREFLSLPADIRRIIDGYWTGQLPIPVAALGRELGLRIYEAHDLGDLVSGQISRIVDDNCDYEILVSASDPRVRKRFTVAHEISHYLLHKDEIGDGITDDVLYRSVLSSHIEAQANRLAADILMPPRRILEELGSVKEYGSSDKIEILSTRFAVSGTAMSIRLQKLL